ncbi:FG-GAP-like repeat-containing protein [Pelagicoccus sp. SDUM812002]|uniref:FG-GAP-like repeat-containing protein n=1 Tax=Pelagicoccus sp. SDUM812002 TaxID=3041266 RepID=UPI00280D3746|nr:FG-GAP-like repeat-containing protein [Pelagicoccus sp. SDUM812002]MDQ8186533.1 FG-GAP-like repeat-containing protein [Pelagicoccus sp. SDUM812002]
MHSDQTGLNEVNEYNDPRAWGTLFREFNNGSLGTGLAVGDYDRDGKPDVGIAYKTGEFRLYRNLGDNRFLDVSEDSGVKVQESFFDRSFAFFKSDDTSEKPWNQGVSFVDIDNNGWLDLYVCRFNEPNQLFINQRDGTFEEEAESRGLDLKDSSVMASFFDYDRDGLLDVYIQTNLLSFSGQPDGREDFLYRNIGDGYFEDVSSSLDVRPETQGHSAIWWDYDGDGWFDLYVANDFAVPDLLYRNNGDGTFSDVASEVLPLVPYSAMGCDIADVNGDGRLDLFVADMAATTRFKDHRTMVSARFAPIERMVGKAIQRPRNCLFLATPSGYLREAAFAAGLDATDWTWSPRFEDLDNDGFEDLFVTNGMNREHHNLDLLVKVARARSATARIAILKNSPVLEERDLLFKGGDGLLFRELDASSGIEEAGVSFGSASGDFDNDGDLDFVVARFNEPPLIYRNDSKSGNRVIFELEGVKSNSFGIGSIVSLRTEGGVQTKQLSNARGYQSTSEPIVHFGLGKNAVVEELTVKWPSGIVDVWQDLEAGSRYRLREGSTGSDETKESSGGGRLFEVVQLDSEGENVDRSVLKMPRKRDDLLEPWSSEPQGPSLVLGDFNSNGKTDALLGGTNNSSPSLIQDLVAPWTSASLKALEVGSGIGPNLAFDANEDGYLDLLVSNIGETAVKPIAGAGVELYLGNGDGNFKMDTSSLFPDVSVLAGVIAAADFDRDGYLDIFISGSIPKNKDAILSRSALLMTNGARWEDFAALRLPNEGQIGIVTAGICSDVDLDGWVDLVLSTSWGTPLFLRNEAGERFTDATEEWGFSSAGSGWWTSIAAADLNSDGKLDYVLGNAGLNTIYRASEEDPIEMLFGKFGSRGKSSFLEFERVDGVRYPRRNRFDLISVYPELRQLIGTSDKFAEMSLEQIFSPESLADAEVYRVSELRSGLLLSSEKGPYRFQPLPSLAQLGATQGIALGDWNADTHVDIALVQNSSTAVSGPWYGGIGLLLQGDGQGGFEELASGSSGFVVPGEGRALGTLDFNRDGWPDLLATRGAKDPILFMNKRVRERASLTISLSQVGTNPSALGSKIRVGYHDGSVRVGELYSTNGHSTQSEAIMSFGYSRTAVIDFIEVHWPDGTVDEFDIEDVESGALRIERGTSRLLWLEEDRS